MFDLPAREPTALQQINETIDLFFLRNTEEAAKISPYYVQLWQDIHRLMGSGGKRLRPLMMLRAYDAFGGGRWRDILPIAASQELLHMSLLIHDDIIDRDYVRYGVDNIAGKYFKSHYDIVEDETERLHYAESAAILAGDLLIAGSYRLMVSSNIDASILRAVQDVHSQSIFDVAGGELIDTEAAFRPVNSIDAQTVAQYKTASYTFVGPLTIGAILAGASDGDVEHLRSFAKSLGVAYQLRDDVIGIFGDEQTIGKPTISDIREGKHTYMVEEFYRLADQEQRARFEQHFGDKHVSSDEAEIVMRLLRDSGALKQTEAAIDDYAQRAYDALSRIGVADMGELHELVTIVTKRDK